MLAGKIAVGQHFLDTVLDLLGSLLQLHGVQFGNDCFSLVAGRRFALLRVDRLEHFCHNFDLGFRHNREKHCGRNAPCSADIWRPGIPRPRPPASVLVADDEFYAVQAASAESLEEADSAGLVLLHSLGSSQNLTKTVLIHGDCHQNRHIFIFSAPVVVQVDAVHIDIRILSTMQGAVAPVLDVDVGFLVQLADGGGRDLAWPHNASVMFSTRRTETPARYISMSASSTLLSRRRYRSMMAVSKDTPLGRGIWSVTLPEVVVRLRS